MKLNKIFAFAIAVLTLSACSDDDGAKWNNDANVTVDMAKVTMSVKENKGLFNVPVLVNGEANGNIMVTVQVSESGATPATEDANYIVTSKTIVIEPEDQAGNIEISTVDDVIINEPREFVITIVDVKGAKVGNQPTTTVLIKDNDAAFYEKLQGDWKFKSLEADGTTEQVWNVSVLGYDEDEAGYNEILYISGLFGYNWTETVAEYHFDMTTLEGGITISMGQTIAEGVSAGLADTVDLALATSGDGGLTLRGDLEGTWSEDFNTVTFSGLDNVYMLGFYSTSGSFSGYSFGSCFAPMTMVR